ncbi:MAG: hypothetical protein ACTSRZ_03830 [Promethearchaeota archaeon]
MKNIFTITPIFGIVFGFLMIGIAVIAMVWNYKIRVPSKIKPLYKGIRGLLFTSGAFIGLLLLDIVIKIGFLGVLSIGNINYHLGALILMTILGISFLLMCVFAAPTLKTIIIFAGVVAVYIYLYWINPSFATYEYEKAFYYPLYYIIPWALFVEIIFILFNLVKKRNILEEKRLWDISKKLKKIFNLKFAFILWLAFSVEVILKMEGLDIFFWI